MNSEAVLAIGGVVGSLTKFVVMSTPLTGRYASLGVLLVTMLCFAVWGYSHNDFSRENTWDYFMRFVETLAITAGAYHGTEEAVKKVTGNDHV